MVRTLILCGFAALATALIWLSSFGREVEREVGLAFLYAARGDREAPDGALVIALDRDSVAWLQRNVERLDEVSEGLDGCLSPGARQSLRQARNINQIPRAIHTCLLRRLAPRAPRVVAFDVNFNAETPYDTAFADAIREAGNVLLLERVVFDEVYQRLAPTRPLLDAAAATVSFQTDGSPGSAVTGYPTRNGIFGDLPAMPVEAWRLHARRPQSETETLPDFQRVWFYGPGGTVPTVPLRSIFDADRAGELPGDLSDRTVFLGASDPIDRAAYDHFRIPMLFAASSMAGGVEIAATAFLNLLHGDAVRAPPPHLGATIVFCFSLAVLLASQLVVGARGLSYVLALALTYAVLASVLFASAGVWLPVFVPLVLVTPLALIATFSARYLVARRIVERLAPRPFARELLNHPEIGRGTSHVEDATIVFVDMVGSTRQAERLGTDRYKALMNRYYKLATEVVEANDGMIIEYIGDGILALFTASMAGRDHAAKACRAACQLSEDASRGSEQADPEARDPFRLRLGIHSGEVITGPTGAAHRFTINAIGDAVNVAARLQELGKKLPQGDSDVILISDDTRWRASLRPERLYPLGHSTLRGRSSPIEVFRLIPG